MNITEKVAKILYKWIEHMPRKPDGILYSDTVRKDLQLLEPTADIQQRQKEYVIGKLSICSLVLFAGVLLSITLWIKDSSNTQIVDNRIYRPSYGEGSRSICLEAGNENETAKLEVVLSEREYTKTELEELYQAFLVELETAILGENTSLDTVVYDLKLVDCIEGYPFMVEWEVPLEYIDCDGKLLQETLENPVVVELTAKISCDAFDSCYKIGCNIHNRAKSFSMQEKLVQEWKALEENSRQQEYVTLPSEFRNQAIEWSKSREHTGLLFFLLTIVSAVLLFLGKDRDLHKQVEIRGEQMQEDYAEIVSKFALLTGAGMTLQGAWTRIVGDYQKKSAQTKTKRFAYEEMLSAIYEINNGCSFKLAIEHFGRRCGLSCYTKFSTLLSQNLRKGSNNLSQLLQAEAREAFEERKHIARKQGEKAATKLLVPMMILLAVVMIIIIVPSMASYFGY